MNPLRGSVVGLAGLVGAGLLAWPVVADDAAPDGFTKRDEQETELVTVEDDDDTRDKTRDKSRDKSRDKTRDVSARQIAPDAVDRDNSRDREVSRDGDSSRDREVSRDGDNSRDRDDTN